MGVTTFNLAGQNNPLRDKRYLILACFENAPGFEKKVFDAMNEIFCDIAAGVENDWTLTEAAQKMQEGHQLQEDGLLSPESAHPLRACIRCSFPAVGTYPS